MAEYRILEALEDDEEIALLSFAANEHNDVFLEKRTLTFDFDKIPEEQCKTLFRFEKNDIPYLCQALQLPQMIRCVNRTMCSNIEGLCILLRRLAYPNRLDDMQILFGRSTTALSFIVNEVLCFIYEKHGHLLNNLDRLWLTHADLQQFCESVEAKGSPLSNCWGFIDGTVRPICRPSENQRSVYNGHKRVHALKFQSIVVPNGLIANMYGPIEGRRHDSGMLRESRLQEQLREYMNSPTGETYVIYGDPAYPLTPYIQVPFRGGVISASQARYNKKMSSVRICVEWAFGKLLSLFAFLDFKRI